MQLSQGDKGDDCTDESKASMYPLTRNTPLPGTESGASANQYAYISTANTVPMNHAPEYE